MSGVEEEIRQAAEAATGGRENGKGPGAPRKAAVHTMSDVEAEDVRWLWNPYIPRRKITMLEGDPGVGKTWVALTVAAVVSQGWPWPEGGATRLPGDVLYLSAEDGIADTLKPRLMAAGADPKRVHALTGHMRVDPETGEEVEEGGVTLADVDVIGDALDRFQPSLVVIDPIQGYLGAKTDMHRANEVRPLMSLLARWAEQYDMAVLILRHLAKSPATRGLYRGLGSIDFAAAARSVLLAGEDPETHERAVVHMKSSLAAAGPSLGFTIDASGFLWSGVSEATAGSLLRPEAVEHERSARDEAREWLEEMLEDGERQVDELKEQVRAAGLSWRTVERAKQDAGVRSVKSSGNGPWVWRIEKLQKTKTANGGAPGKVGGLGEAVAAEGESPPEGDQGRQGPTLGGVGVSGAGKTSVYDGPEIQLEPGLYNNDPTILNLVGGKLWVPPGGPDTWPDAAAWHNQQAEREFANGGGDAVEGLNHKRQAQMYRLLIAQCREHAAAEAAEGEDVCDQDELFELEAMQKGYCDPGDQT